MQRRGEKMDNKLLESAVFLEFLGSGKKKEMLQEIGDKVKAYLETVPTLRNYDVSGNRVLLNRQISVLAHDGQDGRNPIPESAMPGIARKVEEITKPYPVEVVLFFHDDRRNNDDEHDHPLSKGHKGLFCCSLHVRVFTAKRHSFRKSVTTV
jgi:hypothetical protein